MRKYEQPLAIIVFPCQEDILTVSNVSKQDSGVGDIVSFDQFKID